MRWLREPSALAALAAPIALAQLSQMAMGLTDTLMLGGIGERALAAGGLGANLFFTMGYVLAGALSGVAVLTANAVGAGRPADIGRIYWTGLVLGLVLAAPLFLFATYPGPLLRALGEPPALAADIGTYLRVLRWGAPGGLVGIGVIRALLPAIGAQTLLLLVLPAGVAVNAALNLWLIYGGAGVPPLGLRGSALATAVSLTLSAVALAVLLHAPRRWRGVVALARPTARCGGALLAIGVPAAGIVAVEASLFGATGLLAGGLGATALAAHMIALAVAAFSFMVPFSIAQAANVRVATFAGAGDGPGARRAGFAALALAVAYALAAALLMYAGAAPIARAFLGNAGPAATAQLAARLLGIAALFQVFDGVQTTAGGALRGLADTRVPFLLAAFGYWGVGFPLGAWLAFRAGLGAAGLWWGLLAGLAAVAAALTWRFARLTRAPARAVSVAAALQ